MVAREIPAQSLVADGLANLDAAAYFSDPDGDALTYLATTEDPSIVKVYVSGAEISMFASNRGKPWADTTAITVAATDPGGLSAEQDMVETVDAGDVGFREEFDSEAISPWQVNNADEVVRAILAHAHPDRTDVPPETPLDKVLFACDELSGLVYACCLVRPNGIDDLKPKSVAKKLKDKAFARGVHREDVHRGLELIGLARAVHIQNVIDGLRTVAHVLEVRAADLAARRRAGHASK